MTHKRFKIKWKILFVLFILLVMSFGTIGVLSYMDMKELGDNTVSQISMLGKSAMHDSKEGFLEQAKASLQTTCGDQAFITNLRLRRIAAEVETVATLYFDISQKPLYENDVLFALADRKINEGTAFSVFSLAPGVDKKTLKGELVCLSQMDSMLKATISVNPHRRMIHIGTRTGIIMVYPQMSVSPTYDPRNQAWYKQAVTTSRLIWYGPYTSTAYNENVITCGKAVRDRAGRVAAVIAIDVTVESIAKNFIGRQISQKGHAFLVNSRGDIIVRETPKNQTDEWDEALEAGNILENKSKGLREIGRLMMSGKSGVGKCSANGKEVYVAFSPVKAAGLSIGIAMSTADVLQPLSQTEKRIEAETKKNNGYIKNFIRKEISIYVIFAVAVFLFMVIIGVVLSKKITDPISVLEAGAMAIGKGDLDHRMQVRTGDELEILANRFNKMAEDLKRYIKNLGETIAAKERIESDLKMAAEIQSSMLPQVGPVLDGHDEFDLFASMEPAKKVGGDFFDFFFLDNQNLFFCIGDVSGKGVPAALFMVITKTLIKSEALKGEPPNEILLKANNLLEMENDSCMFASVFCATLDIHSGDVEFSIAGHNPPLLCRKTAGYDFLDVPKSVVIGPMPGKVGSFRLRKLTLQPGESLFLYSDGITEAIDQNSQMFSKERLRSRLNLQQKFNAKQSILDIRSAVKQHVGEEAQFDDMTMLSIIFNGFTDPI